MKQNSIIASFGLLSKKKKDRATLPTNIPREKDVFKRASSLELDRISSSAYSVANAMEIGCNPFLKKAKIPKNTKSTNGLSLKRKRGNVMAVKPMDKRSRGFLFLCSSEIDPHTAPEIVDMPPLTVDIKLITNIEAPTSLNLDCNRMLKVNVTSMPIVVVIKRAILFFVL
jgi:hypothetical protein